MKCPNCSSFDISKSHGGTYSIGVLCTLIGFILGGGGEGASSFYGGHISSSIWGIYLFLIGIVLWIYGSFRDSRKQFREYDCKNCKCKFRGEI